MLLIFTKDISKSVAPDESSEPAVNTALPNLVNALLSTDSSESSTKERSKIYLRPENCTFVNVPKLNKEIWSTVTFQSRSIDTSLQDIQQSVLNATILIVKVMEADNSNSSLAGGTPLESATLVRTLSDSLAYLGRALSDSVRQFDISGTYLFGDDFLQDLNDLNTSYLLLFQTKIFEDLVYVPDLGDE